MKLHFCRDSFLTNVNFGNSEVKDIDFRIFVHLIMCKLLPVTMRFWVCFCSKAGKFFMMSLSKLLGGEATTVTAGQESSLQKSIRQGLACISFSGQKQHGGCEWKMRLYQKEKKLQVGAKATKPEHGCQLPLITVTVSAYKRGFHYVSDTATFGRGLFPRPAWRGFCLPSVLGWAAPSREWHQRRSNKERGRTIHWRCGRAFCSLTRTSDNNNKPHPSRLRRLVQPPLRHLSKRPA